LRAFSNDSFIFPYTFLLADEEIMKEGKKASRIEEENQKLN
jgi:hypothetical protein